MLGTVNDDPSPREEKLDQLTREVRGLRRTVLGGFVALCAILLLLFGRDTGVVIFLIVLAVSILYVVWRFVADIAGLSRLSAEEQLAEELRKSRGKKQPSSE
jgi:hypothetical protein